MTVRIDLGTDGSGNPAVVDLEELLATRLLVQGNSGSGKSHLLRRLLEESAGLVQQIVIDPEGDFVSLSDAFGHISIDAAHYSLAEIGGIARRLREHRAFVVLNQEGLEVEGQMRCVGTFLSALFETPVIIGILRWPWSTKPRCSRPRPQARSPTKRGAHRWER